MIDTAFNKKVSEIYDASTEEDVEIIRETLLDYMIANRLYKKNLDIIIQKLKNIDSEELQNFT